MTTLPSAPSVVVSDAGDLYPEGVEPVTSSEFAVTRTTKRSTPVVVVLLDVALVLEPVAVL
jgi:hypothetical protein